jgi:hypothetical protein
MVCEPVYMYKIIDILQVNDQKLESNTQKVFWINYISTLITYAIYALCVFCCSQKLLNYFNFQSFGFKCIYQKHIVRTQLYIYVYYLYCISHMVLCCSQILLNMLDFNMLFLSVHSINISCVLNYISTFLLQSRLKVNCMRDFQLDEGHLGNIIYTFLLSTVNVFFNLN